MRNSPRAASLSSLTCLIHDGDLAARSADPGHPATAARWSCPNPTRRRLPAAHPARPQVHALQHIDTRVALLEVLGERRTGKHTGGLRAEVRCEPLRHRLATGIRSSCRCRCENHDSLSRPGLSLRLTHAAAPAPAACVAARQEGYSVDRQHRPNAVALIFSTSGHCTAAGRSLM